MKQVNKMLLVAGFGLVAALGAQGSSQAAGFWQAKDSHNPWTNNHKDQSIYKQHQADARKAEAQKRHEEARKAEEKRREEARKAEEKRREEARKAAEKRHEEAEKRREEARKTAEKRHEEARKAAEKRHQEGKKHNNNHRFNPFNHR